MALEFTNIPDHSGPAVYLIGNGQSQLERQLTELGKLIDEATPEQTQVVYLDPTRGDGLRIREFYSLHYLPTVFIVMDDDTIAQQWDVTLPRFEEVTYALSQITGSMRTS